MKNIILIIGPSGSGKSTLQSKLKKHGYLPIISSTTRDIRENEVNGIDYHFKKDKEDFFKDEYIEYDQVADKFYGTSVKEFTTKNKIAHVIEPYGANQIIQKFKNNKDMKISVIYMNLSHQQCLENLKGDKGYLSEKDKERIQRDKDDSIHDRAKKVNLPISIELNNLNYSVENILKKLS